MTPEAVLDAHIARVRRALAGVAAAAVTLVAIVVLR